MGSSRQLERIFQEAVAIEHESAQEAGTVSYMARSLVMATLPYRKVEGSEFARKNGAFTLSLLAPAHIGLPYGSLPRLLISWVTTEAVRTKERELILGDTLSEFMRELGIVPTGGRWGSISRLKNQMERLFASSVTASYEDKNRFALQSVKIVDAANLWWDPKDPKQTSMWKSSLILGEKFFNEIIESPVPIDMRALKALKQSPMALDIYTFLTYRMSYLKNPVVIPWEGLLGQMGADYAKTPDGLRNFKKKFLRHLATVKVIYPELNISNEKAGLMLKPSRTHIMRLK